MKDGEQERESEAKIEESQLPAGHPVSGNQLPVQSSEFHGGVHTDLWAPKPNPNR